MRKRIIVYYSLTNNTKEAAIKLAEKIEAEVCRIETVKSMPEKKSRQMMIGGMQSMFGISPKIKGVMKDLLTYDEVVLGTPVWAGKNVPALNTLLKSKALRDKVTAVFTFSGGGDNEQCIKKLKKKLPNLKYTIALADRSNQLAIENHAKLELFAEELLDGER